MSYAIVRAVLAIKRKNILWGIAADFVKSPIFTVERLLVKNEIRHLNQALLLTS